MSAITIENDLVHYEVLGRGRPVIFVHGWLGSWRYWVPTMQQLSVKYRTYALDLWGFGDSGKEANRYAFKDQVQLLAEFMDKLGITKAALVGHSLGAAICLRFAALYPDRAPRVVLISPPLFDLGGLDDGISGGIVLSTAPSVSAPVTPAPTPVAPTVTVTATPVSTPAAAPTPVLSGTTTVPVTTPLPANSTSDAAATTSPTTPPTAPAPTATAAETPTNPAPAPIAPAATPDAGPNAQPAQTVSPANPTSPAPATPAPAVPTLPAPAPMAPSGSQDTIPRNPFKAMGDSPEEILARLQAKNMSNTGANPAAPRPANVPAAPALPTGIGTPIVPKPNTPVPPTTTPTTSAPAPTSTSPAPATPAPSTPTPPAPAPTPVAPFAGTVMPARTDAPNPLLKYLAGKPAELLSKYVAADAPDMDKLMAEVKKTDDAAIMKSAQSFNGINLAVELKRMASPTLLLHGKDDPVIPAPSDELLIRINKGKPAGHLLAFVEPDIRHFPMLEITAKFNRLLLDFLEAQDLNNVQFKDQWRRTMR